MSKEAPYAKNPITEDDINKLKKIMENLEQDPQAFDFKTPVDYVALGIPDYPTIIKQPMDLGTVKENLLSHKYQKFSDFLSDIDLIWSNCRTYNMAGSEICKMATHCEKALKKALDKQFKNAPSNKNQSSSTKQNKEKEIIQNDGLTMEEKINFTDKIRTLPNETLTKVVKAIIKECPKGIEDIDSEKLQIKVDLIDHKTYNIVMNVIGGTQKPSNNDGEKE